MYNRIVNPETNRLVSLRTSTGNQILRNYINQLGGVNIYRCPSSIKTLLYTGIEGECLGCESGTDEDQAHRLEDGRFHPNCATRAAEEEKEKELDMEEECLGCESGTGEDQAHRLEDGRFHPNCATRAAEQEKEKELDMEEECLGCESGTGEDQAHRLEDGRFHPNCATRAAEAYRTKPRK
jgi:hypothetical protein